MIVEFNCISEPVPGPKWRHWFNHFWPTYRAWFLSQGEAERPTYREVMRALERHMPELLAEVERMTELAGGGDHAARFLGQYCPPPFFAACSQALLVEGEPALVRNYDYSPRLFDALVLRSDWQGREVIGMSDCMSGLLDGMNASGLAVSLAFGGRGDVGAGFGISLILRYLLETCDSVDQALERLAAVPVQIAYNIALLDREGDHAIVELAPGAAPRVSRDCFSTNHQQGGNWNKYLDMVESGRRYDHLGAVMARPDLDADGLTASFLEPPLFRESWDAGYGTLYTAVYLPLRNEVRYVWQDDVRVCPFGGDGEWRHPVRFSDLDADSTPLWPGVHHSAAGLRDVFAG